MKRYIVGVVFLLMGSAHAQTLSLKHRRPSALSGAAFAQSISDPALSFAERENKIYEEIRKGNIPDYLRQLTEINDTLTINGTQNTIKYWVLPDYMAIGNNDDFFYCPMTPMLAQRVADLTKTHLPTKKIVDVIYAHAIIKLPPKPIPPTLDMITVPIFIAHNDTVRQQLKETMADHSKGALTAGNKKDIIISNKIYRQTSPRVVIYGWHTAEGKPIQPVYNKHKNTWADYSHGTRLIQNKMFMNGKKTTYQKVLVDAELCSLLSDEGLILIARYPESTY